MHITPATFLTCVMCIIYLVIYSFPLHAHSITWCPQANLTRDWVRQLYVVHRQCISRVALPSRANVAAAADSNSFSVMQRGSELQSPVSSRRLDRPLSTRKPTTDGKRINPDRHSAVSCMRRDSCRNVSCLFAGAVRPCGKWSSSCMATVCIDLN